jgi:hypothetical protein
VSHDALDGFLLPVGRVLAKPTGVPYAMKGQVHAADNMAQVQEIGRSFGRGYKPQKPILIHGPFDKQVIVIAGMGEAEAAEIEDVAIAKLAQAEERARKGEPAFDFEANRERIGYPSASKFDENFRLALEDKIKRHKKNPRTDPNTKPHTKRIF